MCGLAGFWEAAPQGEDRARAIGEAMASRIASRGPDDAGVWSDLATGITFAHRRLAVVDLSSAGHQPMVSHSGRFVLNFNGEIYNHLDLREELSPRAIPWRGHSDTETLLAGIDAWGVEATLRKCTGMFALALWDRSERVLVLARDRMGEKPLYYGWQRGVFLFASQPKALKAHPAFAGEIDRDALALFLRHSYVPSPYSIYRGIRKLPPGTFLTLPLVNDSLPEPVPYWRVIDAVTAGLRHPFAGSEAEAVTTLEHHLAKAIGLQMIADVPLGAFLSGGIDSSIVVALMQAQSTRPVRTFTIGFREAEYDEAGKARAVAQHLGTDHTELYVTPDDARDVIPLLPEIYDEPFADSTQIPNYLVSQMARRHVTVSLSGDGGDELFGGYKRYLHALKIWPLVATLPSFSRRSVAGAIRAVPAAAWNAAGKLVRKDWLLAGRASTFADLVASRNREELYQRLMSDWPRPDDVVIGATEPVLIRDMPPNAQFADLMMYIDLMSYLTDGILVKVDRAAMAVSLETRVPFLDHRVVEFAWTLPLSSKIRNGEGKWILRRLVEKHLPRELARGPKKGFTLPIASWLRGPLRDWAESLLSEERLKREGFLRLVPVRESWRDHVERRRERHTQIWNVLMFQAWLAAMS